MEKLLEMMTVAFDKHAEEIRWTEAQIVFVNAAAKVHLAERIDHDAVKECDQANKRLFALFSAGWSDEKWMFKAYWARLKHPNQVSHPNLQRVSDAGQIHDGHVANAALDPRDVRPVEVGGLGKLLLCQAQLEPAALDFLTQRYPGIGDFRDHVPDLFRS